VTGGAATTGTAEEGVACRPKSPRRGHRPRRRSGSDLRATRNEADARPCTNPRRVRDGSRARRQWRTRCRSESPVVFRVDSLTRDTRRRFDASHTMMDAASSAGSRT
jgi:hypothetical protein